MMKNNVRALFGVSALALLLTAMPVFANVDVVAENHLTGANSDNENKFDIDNDGDITLDNVGDVDNSASADVNTGGNDQEKNTSGGDLTSGHVDASTDWESVINQGADLCGCPVGGEEVEIAADFRNDTTGAYSDNENKLDVDMGGDVAVRNVADVANWLGLWANTGHNDQEKNTEAGDLETGDVTLAAMISNMANSSEGNGSNSGRSLSVDFTGSNHLTGAKSDNENKVEVDADGDTRVTNVAAIDNGIRVQANTGHNDQNKNTTAGSLTTGNVEVSTDIVNVANSGDCCPTGRSVSVTADLSNDTTGAESDNENKLDLDADGDTTVTNTATVSNELDVHANTGGNDQSSNTTGGDIHTGDVSINFGVSNSINSN